MKAIVFFTNFGPYHLARARGLNRAAAGQVRFVEVAGKEKKYSWTAQASEQDPKIYTLFQGAFEDAPLLPTLRACIEQVESFGANTLLIPGYHERLWVLLAAWARMRGKRTVLMFESNALDRPRTGWKEKLKGLLVNTLFQGAFVGGVASRNYLGALGYRGAVWTGYDIVDNSYFAQGASEFPSSEPYFISINRLVSEKNLSALLDAYALYRKLSAAPWKLLILGDGPLEGELRAKIQRLSLEGQVELRGFLQAEQVRPLLQGAGALVLYSVSEPWGLVVNEALAARLPVIVTDRAGSAADLVNDGCNGFVVSPLDPAQLAHTLLRVERLSAGERTAFAERSAQILQHYTPDTWGQVALAAARGR